MTCRNGQTGRKDEATKYVGRSVDSEIRQLLSSTAMRILALDTTTRAGSCALARDGAVLHEVASDPHLSHAEHLPADLIRLLEAAQTGLEAIDVFAVAIGPGSFTGLRVGIATMQGLAFATGKPLIGVSTLDALASLTRPEDAHLVATWVGAWRGEVYAALYGKDGEVESPTVEHPTVILQRLHLRVDRAGPLSSVTFIGEGAGTFGGLIREALGERAVLAQPAAPLLAGAIAQLAHAAALSGERTAPDAIRPLYVRRTDAELTRDARASH
jgi:tRNA threonylcarbamoyladenosine biosynthesis protein TsaB